MRILENRIPPPVVATLCGVAMWGLAAVAPGIAVADAARLAVAGLAVLAGLVFCLGGVVSFRRAKTTVNPLRPASASSLVTSGIYRVSRNPMYVGFALFLVAWAAWLSSPWALAGVAGFVLYITRLQIVPEERALAALFGDGFARYCARVRRWL